MPVTLSPTDYNYRQFTAGDLTMDDVTLLVEHFQRSRGLAADGKAGPRTLATLRDCWLPDVTHMPADPSWYGGPIRGPLGVVAHYTATDPGTAVNMARNRMRQRTPADRAASWHLTIDTDGSVVQMVPLDRIAWHAGGTTAQPVKGLGSANSTCIGIELVGHGKEFPPAQVESAKRVWRALVQRYGIERQYAMITHQEIDPTRRTDPGPVWMGQHAGDVLEAAYK